MSNRKKSQQAVSTTDRSGIFTLGLDIGYGVTKAVTEDAAIAFPSVAGHARRLEGRLDAVEEQLGRQNDLLERIANYLRKKRGA